MVSAFDFVAKLPLVLAYEHAFRELMGLPLQMVRPDTPPTPESMGRWLSPFCRMLAGRCQSELACWRGHECRAHCLAAQRLQPQVLKCFAGFQVLAVPVRVSRRHVATWLGGQVLSWQPTRGETGLLAGQLNRRGIPVKVKEVRDRLRCCRVIYAARLRAIGCLLTLSALHVEEALRRAQAEALLDAGRG